MASVYVHSGAAGAGTGADWANAYTTLAAALSAKAAGDVFYVAHDHAESTAALVTLTSPGTDANPCNILCVNRSGSVPPVSADLATTGTVSTTNNNNINFGGTVGLCRGITFTAGNSTASPFLNIAQSTGQAWNFEKCALRIGSSGSSARIILGTSATGASLSLTDTTVQFAGTGQSIVVQGRVRWRNTGSAVTGAILPTTLFKFAASVGAELLCEGVDFSALGSGKTLFDTSAAGNASAAILKDCKLGSSVTVSTTPSGVGYPRVMLVRSDSGDTNYRHEIYDYSGTQTTETTIVRTGGASDGTTPISWKIITTANSKRYLPFEALPISIWNETTGTPITLTVEGIWGGGAVPTNANIWMDVEYLGTSGFPIGSFATSGPADQLAAGTNLSAGSGTWGGSTTKFTLAKTITPQEKGPVTVYIRAALASSVFYLDPKLTVS